MLFFENFNPVVNDAPTQKCHGNLSAFEQIKLSRDCGEKTCLAFAGSVYTGRRDLTECPHLAPEVIQKFSGEPMGQKTPEESRLEITAQGLGPGGVTVVSIPMVPQSIFEKHFISNPARFAGSI